MYSIFSFIDLDSNIFLFCVFRKHEFNFNGVCFYGCNVANRRVAVA